MSSSTLLARPSLATLSFGVAAATWSGLCVATGMMLAAEGRFAGNPLYTLTTAVAITATVVGIQLRCHVDSAPSDPTMAEVTREIHLDSRIYGVARPIIWEPFHVEPMADHALPADNVAAFELGREVERARRASG